jgi:hypothetical protein
VGEASRVRRRAKLDKERQHRRRQRRQGQSAAHKSASGWAAPDGPRWQQADPGGPGRSSAQLAEQLVSDAMHAQSRGDHEAFERCVAQLAGRPGGAGWKRIADRVLLSVLVDAVTTGWHQGWQPAEAVRQAERQFGTRHARMATDAVAAEMRGYATATIDERWEGQLAALGATAWWGSDDGYLELWRDRERIARTATVTCALELLYTFATLPELHQLCPLPGTARRRALHSERSRGRPVDERMLSRVRALLAKAESTEFPEEAEALSSRAQELMARHSIDDAFLAAAGQGKAGPGQANLLPCLPPGTAPSTRPLRRCPGADGARGEIHTRPRGLAFRPGRGRPRHSARAPSSNRRRRMTSALGQQIAVECSPHGA